MQANDKKEIREFLRYLVEEVLQSFNQPAEQDEFVLIGEAFLLQSDQPVEPLPSDWRTVEDKLQSFLKQTFDQCSIQVWSLSSFKDSHQVLRKT